MEIPLNIRPDQLSQTHAALIVPLDDYVKHDFVQLAETRKRFSRSSDECDAAINKYASRKPGKDSQLAEVCHKDRCPKR